jgi:hypothetical protein
LIWLSLDLTYHAWRLMFDDKSFFAPVKNPQAILDIGTGTGMLQPDFLSWVLMDKTRNADPFF